ncbi:unnamed protein product, partial [Nesidiocoris tenuis]
MGKDHLNPILGTNRLVTHKSSLGGSTNSRGMSTGAQLRMELALPEPHHRADSRG